MVAPIVCKQLDAVGLVLMEGQDIFCCFLHPSVRFRWFLCDENWMWNWLDVAIVFASWPNNNEGFAQTSVLHVDTTPTHTHTHTERSHFCPVDVYWSLLHSRTPRKRVFQISFDGEHAAWGLIDTHE